MGEAVRSFFEALMNDYHSAKWPAVAAGLFFILALCTFRRMRPAGRALILLALISGRGDWAGPIVLGSRELRC